MGKGNNNRGRRRDNTPRRKLSLETLEQRLLLSADAAILNLDRQDALLPDQTDIAADLQQTALALPADSAYFDPQAAVDGALAGSYQEVVGRLRDEAPRTELIIIDGSVPDYQRLLDGLLAQSVDGTTRYEVAVLDAGEDGLEQISGILSQYRELSALHLLSHGDEGTLRLGTSLLDGDILRHDSQRLAQWGEALTGAGDILIYGCGIAQGELGAEFVQRLAAASGADVAASADSTGSTALGGDWTLEYQSGSIETRALRFDAYQHLMGQVLGTAGDDTLGGDTGVDDTLANRHGERSEGG
ncbi:MAG: hypothetical protein B0D96_05525 [Candidatus Sedimenticola endophacoides]|nr:MAG: hypothetical protein B0D94_00450 [Candidatus Sedimenticola endophacoides]OQX35953.1 MAG: hypothetical protein B0D96_05525 [Candidatus Sedimenticola endophacoides]OQX49314.1 MAG: hypothetical protein B0D87_01010 [Candidatus Sedimenticola endophacoides]PUE03449.1 MAG: hypothetical protein C3L26_00530 [Candidatus Sedimenticola endophacoides]PUE05532.1 MAG: hypothetical protein C3L25_00545 [Candidatus Sedimenticola endophacoides]